MAVLWRLKIFEICLFKEPTICKSRNGQSGKGMRGMQGIGVNVVNGGGNAGNQGGSLGESSCLLLRLKSRSVRRAFHHPAFMGSCPTISHTFFALSTK